MMAIETEKEGCVCAMKAVGMTKTLTLPVLESMNMSESLVWVGFVSRR